MRFRRTLACVPAAALLALATPALGQEEDIEEGAPPELASDAPPEVDSGEVEDDGLESPDGEEPGAMSVEKAVDPRDREASEETDSDGQKGFVKGELAAVGRILLVSKFHRVGVEVGAAGFGSGNGQDLYAHINPIVELNYPDSNLSLGFNVPLNFFAFETGKTVDRAFKRVGELRQEGWDDVGDYLQVIRYAAYGGKEEPFFLSLSQVDSRTIGHGPVVRRYVPNLDVNRHRLSGQFDAYNDHGGFEIQVNDVSAPNIIGALAFLKPGSFIGSGRPLKRLSAGVHYTTDLNAPVGMSPCECTVFDSKEELDRGHFAGDPVTGRPVAVTTEALHFVGMDVEFKPLRTSRTDLKPYLDYTQMVGYGGGLTLGVLGRFNVGMSRHSAFRLRLEARTFDADYIPSYFDLVYEVERVVSLQAINDPARNAALTKLAYLKSQGGGERRFGVYGEATYALRNWFALSGAWEQSTAAASKSMLLHLELFPSKWFTLFFTYVKRNFEAFDSDPTDFVRSDVRRGSRLDLSDELFFWAFRVKLLPILALNWRAQKSFEIRDNRYQDVFHFVGTLEVGYEF